MLEADIVALEVMMKEFEELANLSEHDFHRKGTPQLKMAHYKTVFNVASRGTKNARDILFIHFQSMLTNYLLRYKDLTVASDDEQFHKVCVIWHHYKLLMEWNLSAFRYFSRLYRKDLEETAVTIFMERIWRKCAQAVFRVALKRLHAERIGESGDSSDLVTSLNIASMSQLNDFDFSYEEDFIEPYLQQCIEDFKDIISMINTTSGSASIVFSKIQGLLHAEEKRCCMYFPSARHEQIMRVIKDTIRSSDITEKRLLTADDGLLQCFEANDVSALKKYFEIFFSEDSTLFPSAFQAAVERCGARIGADPSIKPRAYAKAVIDLHHKCTIVVDDCFGKVQLMASAVRRALDNIFSMKLPSSENRSFSFWDCFTFYIDHNMRHGLNESIDARSLSVMCCLHDDTTVLNSLAESMLQRVLFPEGSFDMKAEKGLVRNIIECLGKKVPQLESILNDLEVSNSFMETLTSEKLSPENVSFLALRRSNWMVKRLDGPSFTLPVEITKKLDSLQRAYLSGTRYRTFKWCHHASSAILLSSLGTHKEITLLVTAAQAVFLLQLDSQDSIIAQAFCEQNNMTLELLSATLFPLFQEKIIVRENKDVNKSLEANDRITINNDFDSDKTTLNLTRRSLRESGDIGITKIEGTVSRPGGVDAAIISYLKKKSESHENLLRYCKETLPFTVNSSFIKSRIEELIRKGLITRSVNGSAIYTYEA